MDQAPMNDPLFIGDDKSKITSSSWRVWFTKIITAIGATKTTGFTGTIVTIKLTAGGGNGSMTFVNGVLIIQVQAT